MAGVALGLCPSPTFLRYYTSPNDTEYFPLWFWQELEDRNQELEKELQKAEQSLKDTHLERDRIREEIGRAGDELDIKICQLNELRLGLSQLLEGN